MEHGITGGITGYIRSNAQISKCYNIGLITNESNVIGGIVGHVNVGTISECYYLENTVNNSNDPTEREGIERKNSEQLKKYYFYWEIYIKKIMKIKIKGIQYWIGNNDTMLCRCNRYLKNKYI